MTAAAAARMKDVRTIFDLQSVRSEESLFREVREARHCQHCPDQQVTDFKHCMCNTKCNTDTEYHQAMQGSRTKNTFVNTYLLERFVVLIYAPTIDFH